MGAEIAPVELTATCTGQRSKICAQDHEEYFSDHAEEHQGKEQICHPETERGSGKGDMAADMVERYPKFWKKAHGCLPTHWVACSMHHLQAIRCEAFHIWLMSS